MSLKIQEARLRSSLLTLTGQTVGTVIGPVFRVSASTAPVSTFYGLVGDLTAGAADTLDVTLETSFDKVNWTPVGSFAQLVASGFQNTRFPANPIATFLRVSSTVTGTGSWDVQVYGAGIEVSEEM